jgi:asparagine synthase (glutamine-hydrolysing)
MCGIAGRVNQFAPVDRGQIFEMTERLSHRGPDDHGYHLRSRIGLGHRRLSIIDRAGGRQPLANERETVWIVYNGEVYNHLDLRRELAGRGHRFRTQSDTEAIVHAYEEWGPDLCRRLRGMFAFALWDEKERSLLLARDRLGIKPLYYALLGSDLIFASELKALLVVPGIDRALDEEALSAYLTLRYVPAPLTMFRNIRKLPPAHILRWHHGRIELKPYWDLADLADGGVPPNEAEAALELRERIDEATEMRLMSEVPVGAFLSGGIDSSLITSAMVRSRGVGEPLHSFSVGFSESGHASGKFEDELDYARIAARALGTIHHEVRISGAEVADELARIIWYLDEPVADAAAVPLYFLSRYAKSFVTVVLSGEGADETLAGYSIYQRALLCEALRRRSFGLVGACGSILSRLKNARAVRLGRLLAGPLERSYRGVARAFDPTDKRQLWPLGDEQPIEHLMAPLWLKTAHRSPLRRLLYIDSRMWLPDDLLIKADRMTMAHGIELRVPFLDHPLVEHAWTLPDHLKLSRGVGKALLRRAARGRVPEAILSRPKMGFATPVEDWLRQTLYPLARDGLLASKSFTRGRFNFHRVEKLLEEHRSGLDRAPELWPLVVLELWHRSMTESLPEPQKAETPEVAISSNR